MLLGRDFAVRPGVREERREGEGAFAVFELLLEQEPRFLWSAGSHFGSVDGFSVGPNGADELLERFVVVVQLVDRVFLVPHRLLPRAQHGLHLLVVFFEAGSDQARELRELQVLVHALIIRTVLD